MQPTVPFRLRPALLVIPLLAVAACEPTTEPESPSDIAATDLHALHTPPMEVTQLTQGLAGGSGSTIGPGGALFVAEPGAGRISRVDPKSGESWSFASGLPVSPIGAGGVMDVAFIGETAYVLVTLVDDPLFPTGEINGIYRVDGPSTFTIVADLGAYNVAHQPTAFPIFLETGVLYALEPYRGGFLVTDGHFNRVLHVTLDRQISQFMTFGNTVPTGLEVWGDRVYMAEAGPVPHLAEHGRIVAFGPRSSSAWEVASGARLMVDVERGRGGTLYALSQGDWEGTEADAGAPALPDKGALVAVTGDGTFTRLVEELDRPTSLEFIGNTAYVVTLTGEVWKIDNVSGPPFGIAR
jgi:hypothetical protein